MHTEHTCLEVALTSQAKYYSQVFEIYYGEFGRVDDSRMQCLGKTAFRLLSFILGHELMSSK